MIKWPHNLSVSEWQTDFLSEPSTSILDALVSPSSHGKEKFLAMSFKYKSLVCTSTGAVFMLSLGRGIQHVPKNTQKDEDRRDFSPLPRNQDNEVTEKSLRTHGEQFPSQLFQKTQSVVQNCDLFLSTCFWQPLLGGWWGGVVQHAALFSQPSTCKSSLWSIVTVQFSSIACLKKFY